ncbi:FAD/NAD(P)-binding domain-containing protein [Didymella exigua CBS 183.55]|uniref:FAD/NAD(P)-binding domain-containing protein n=1 Tax=Didymella exigua CBS 183.55 TaxID=1150837 RepID=A0A6A5RTD5_9PLEO|nr:FAD/NAD(P)-binding domain-containing protein [Didymella exigua CBS 183.55]KAF1929586.1 FAD/NAD(P)-binding domain-containing protein [Didymella exigua CBS 183.55]
MADQQFDIAIIGAGIGGLALAIGLTHHRIPFTIYESAPAFSTIGAGVGLGPNSLKAMDLIDKRLRDKYMQIATGNLRPEKRHVMMEAMRMEDGLGEGEKWWGHGEWGAPYFERTGAHRKDLLDIMTSFIDVDAVRFGRTVAKVEQNDDQVTLAFTDGSVATHAAAIGCGGIRGLERRAVLDDRYPDSVEPQYTNKYVYRTIISMEDAKQILGDLSTDAKMYMSRTSNLSTYPISGGRQVNVVAFKRDSNNWTHPGNTYEVDRKTMAEDFSDIKVDDRLLKLFEFIAPTRWAIFDHPSTPTYYNSLVCLVGDVAHASGPHQGAGAGQGLEDALVLTHALGKLCTAVPAATLNTPSAARTRALEAAFAAYDEIRRPRAQKQVRTARECGEIYNLRDPLTGADLSIEDALQDLNARFEWLWTHDLAADVRLVEEKTAALLRALEQR